MKNSGISAYYCLFLIIFALFCSNSRAAELDTSKYIPIDEVRSDMEGYCLTVFSGMDVERFPLKVLSVARNQKVGQDMIVVLVTDERFKHAGTIHGCSGSPVFIDGRLAGALAAGWDGSLDALYLVRPIENMLEVGSVETAQNVASKMALHFDFSEPLDLADIYRQAMEQLQNHSTEQGMLVPLSSSLPSQTCETFRQPLRQMGLVPMNAPTALPTVEEATAFESGGVLAAVMCGGDISLAATGTVTEIIGDQLYGFGHNFKGEGPTNLPMAAGIVHAVVANRNSSFKFSSPGPILGTLRFDQTVGVRGTIGETPKTIPLTIRVNRDNDPEQRTYNCFLAVDRFYTPMILQMAVNGAAQMQGPLPSEHTVRYETQIRVKGQKPIVFKDVSSGQKTSGLEKTLYSIVSLLLNNPFEEVKIESIDANIDIVSENSLANVWAVDVSQTRIKPGETISAAVTLRSFRSEESTATIEFQIPETISPGNYTLQIMGASDYQRFVSKMMPHRFRAIDIETLSQVFQRVSQLQNNRLYAVMPIAASGIVLRQHELPQLPPTKMLLMQDAKRLLPVEAYKTWSESEIKLDKIVQGGAEIEITVE